MFISYCLFFLPAYVVFPQIVQVFLLPSLEEACLTPESSDPIMFFGCVHQFGKEEDQLRSHMKAFRLLNAESSPINNMLNLSFFTAFRKNRDKSSKNSDYIHHIWA